MLISNPDPHGVPTTRVFSFHGFPNLVNFVKGSILHDPGPPVLIKRAINPRLVLLASETVLSHCFLKFYFPLNRYTCNYAMCFFYLKITGEFYFQ